MWPSRGISGFQWDFRGLRMASANLWRSDQGFVRDQECVIRGVFQGVSGKLQGFSGGVKGFERVCKGFNSVTRCPTCFLKSLSEFQGASRVVKGDCRKVSESLRGFHKGCSSIQGSRWKV